MVKELQRGNWINNFPIRWSADLAHGFGYPLYLFYAPLVYYAGAILMIFGKFSHIVATKWVYAFPLLVGPIFFYLAARQKMSRLPATLGACTYALFPFRGYDTYIRGGVGEAWSMAFLPMIFAGIFLLEKNKRWGGILFSLFLALAILSHNLSGLLITALIIIYGFIFYRKSADFWKSFFLGLGLSAFFWLPAYYYLNIVKVSYSNQNTGQILNFLEPISTFFKVEIPYNPEARFSSLIFYLFILILAIFVWQYKKINKKYQSHFIFWITSGFIFYCILFQPFAFIWKMTLPITRLIQFPWRILIVLSFIIPFLLGCTIELIKKNRFMIPLVMILISLNLFYLPVFKPREYSFFYEYSAADTGICATSWGDEYLPVWVKLCAGGEPSKKIDIKNGSVKLLKSDNMDLLADVNVEKKTDLIVYKYYFPGWQVFVDGKKQPVDYSFSEQGNFKTQVMPGHHKVQVIFSKTAIMWMSDFITIISLIFFIWRFFPNRLSKMKIFQ